MAGFNSNVSPALINFPIVDPKTGLPTPQFFQAWQSMAGGATAGNWTPALAGSAAAGRNVYAAQWGLRCSLGPVTLCLFSITLSTADSGMSGNAEIVGLPGASLASGQIAGWLSEWGNITLSSGAFTTLGVSVPAGADAAVLMQSGSGSLTSSQPLSTAYLSNNAHLTGGFIYPTT